MVFCTNCKTENPERNYYCKYCGLPLKNGREGRVKKLKERYYYLLDLDIVEDNSNDKDYFGSYTAKVKRKKES